MTLAVGDPLPPFVITITPDSMKVWAPILHDPNRIHLDPDFVKAMGLGDRVINQGPANLAYVMNALMMAFPGGTIESVEVRFLDNAFGGDVVEAGGKIIEQSTEAGRRRSTCEVWLNAPGSRPVLGGRAVMSVPI